MDPARNGEVAERGRRVAGRGRGIRMRGGRRIRGRSRAVVSDEIRATVIDHVVNHGHSMREAGQRVQPNLQRSTVASIVRVFRQTNRTQRLPHTGGRGRMFTDVQETAIVDMVIRNNGIKLTEIRHRVLADNVTFPNIHSVSITTISRVLKKHQVRMKQLYTVPFERNSEHVKQLRNQYVQRVMEIEGRQTHHIFIFVDEAGFNLAKARRRRPLIGPYNTERLLAFLHDLYGRVVLAFIIVWDNVAFHHSRAVTEWFAAHPRMESLFLPPYSPFLNPIEEFFSSWRWKVYDHHPHDQMSLLDAMNAGCLEISAEDCQGWIRHPRRFFPRCIALDDIRCDVDENLWPNGEDRVD
ncbi:beta-galactoside alpha-2,3-sialyltransferase (sialyltransferase 4A) [Sarotherodon galilaeus]